MPGSWFPSGLKVNDIRRVLTNRLAALFGATSALPYLAPPSYAAPVVGPISPLATTSSLVGEAFVLDAAHCFSDTARTIPCNVGDAIASVSAYGAGRTEILTKGASAPVFQIEASSGRGCSHFSGGQSLYRSVRTNPKTILVIYKGINKLSRPYTRTICNEANSNTDAGYSLSYVMGSGYFASDALTFSRYKADGTTVKSSISGQMGAVDVILHRNDGLTYEMQRAGVKATSSVVTTTAADTSMSSTQVSMLGCGSLPSGGLQEYFSGDILAFFTWPGKLSDAEAAGVQQWAENYALTQLAGSKYMFIGFQGYGVSATESASNQGFVCATTDEPAGGQWTNRPINGQTGVGNSYRDISAAWDDATQAIYVIPSGSTDVSLPIFKMTDGQNLLYLSKIDMSASELAGYTDSTSGTVYSNITPFCPAFMKNKDGSLWKDTNGLPMVFFQGAPASSPTNTQWIYYVQPVDSTWTTGGAWGAPVRCPGLAQTGVDRLIDPAPILVDGMFYMFLSDYSTANGGIIYATSTSALGPWNLVNTPNKDVFGFGTHHEGPYPIWRGGSNWTMMMDFDGGGYQYATSTTGILGPYSAVSSITVGDGLQAPYYFEQGEFIRVPTNLLSPMLQANYTPSIPVVVPTIAAGQITLAISAVPNGSPITAFEVHEGSSSGGESSTPLATISTGSTSRVVPDAVTFTDTGTTDGVQRFYKVVAVCGAGTLNTTSAELQLASGPAPVASNLSPTPTQAFSTTLSGLASGATLSGVALSDGTAVTVSGLTVSTAAYPTASSGQTINLTGTVNLTGGNTYPFSVPLMVATLWTPAFLAPSSRERFDTNVTLSGSAINAVRSSGSVGGSYAPGVAPTLSQIAGTAAGQPGAKFNGTSQYLAGSSAELAVTNAAPGVTMYAIFAAGASVASAVIDSYGTTSGSTRASISMSTGKFACAARSTDAQSSAVGTNGATTLTPGSLYCGIAEFNLPAGTTELRVNGAVDATGTVTTASTFQAANGASASLGGLGAGSYFNGTLYEAGTIRGLITAQLKQLIEGYANAEFGLPLTGPAGASSGHPFTSFPPTVLGLTNALTYSNTNWNAQVTGLPPGANLTVSATDGVTTITPTLSGSILSASFPNAGSWKVSLSALYNGITLTGSVPVLVGNAPAAAPSVAGVATPGSTLLATPGMYASGTTFRGQWLRNGVPIQGATGVTYTPTVSDGPNLSYLETATTSAGVSSTQRAVAQYLGNVSSGCRIPDNFTNNKTTMSRVPLIAQEALSKPTFIFPGFLAVTAGTSPTGSAAENTGGNVNLTASVEYPAGTFTQITFGGSVTGVIPGGLLASDAVSLNIPAGAIYWLRTFQSGGANGSWLNNKLDTANGGVTNTAASGVADQTMGGDITSSGSTAGFYPAAVVQPTFRSTIGVLGDSRVDGIQDSFDGTHEALGCVPRAVEAAGLSYLNVGTTGDRGAWYNSAHAQRARLLIYCSHVICEYGINDIDDAGYTAAQMQTMYQALWTNLSGLNVPVYQVTNEPYQGGSTTQKATRVSNNAYIRSAPAPLNGYFDVADVVETARDSGVWKTGYSSDGLHALQAGAQAVAASGIITAGMFVR